jgi:large subunit ribosomal protein L9
VAGTTNSSVELLLAEPIPSLGLPGDLVRVKPGFARNYLIPQGLATVATEENRHAVEKHRARLLELQAGEIKQLEGLAERIAAHSVTIEANANEDGQLYGSVNRNDISRSLVKADLEVTPEQIVLSGVLKELGMYTVPVQLHEHVETEMKVWIVPSAEEMAEEMAEERGEEMAEEE